MYHQCGLMTVPVNKSLCKTTNETALTQVHANSFEMAIELYVISLLCVIGLLGNIVAYVVLQKDRERREALFLLQTLALADAFYLIIAILRYPLKYLIAEEAYFSMQLFIFPLLKTAQAVTIWMLLLVTMDRFIYVCMPLRAQDIFNSRTRRVMSVLVFVIGLLYNIPRFFDSCVWTFHDLCSGARYSRMVYTPPFNNTYYFDIYKYASYLLLLYIGPLSILIILNTKLILAIKRSRRRNRQLGTCQVAHHMHQSETNASIVLIIIVIVFIVCETPELVLKILIVLRRHMESMEMMFSRDFIHTFTTTSELLMVLNSSVNFIIYCAFGRRFRHVMRETFKKSFTHTTLITHESLPLQQQQINMNHNHMNHYVPQHPHSLRHLLHIKT